jgi:multiple antibiotic resistance protein
VESFLLAFIPLFVAIDVFGVLPFFVALTRGLDNRQKKKLTREATFTAFVVSVVFLVAGKVVFTFLGITENDFRVGGGIVLLVLAVYDLLFSRESPSRGESVGVVPIGIPLIMGPAALATILILVDSHGYGWAIASLCANLLIVFVVFIQSDRIAGALGEAWCRGIAKVAALFLAGIAVMMIRSGISAIVGE